MAELGSEKLIAWANERLNRPLSADGLDDLAVELVYRAREVGWARGFADAISRMEVAGCVVGGMTKKQYIEYIRLTAEQAVAEALKILE